MWCMSHWPLQIATILVRHYRHFSLSVYDIYVAHICLTAYDQFQILPCYSTLSHLSPLFSLPTYIYISYMLFLSAYTPPTLSDAWDLVLGQVATPSQQLSKGHRQPIPPYLPVHLIQPSSLIRIWHLLFFYTNLFLPIPSFPQPPFQLHGLFFSAPQSLCFSSAMRMHTPFPPVFQPCS